MLEQTLSLEATSLILLNWLCEPGGGGCAFDINRCLRTMHVYTSEPVFKHGILYMYSVARRAGNRFLYITLCILHCYIVFVYYIASNWSGNELPTLFGFVIAVNLIISEKHTLLFLLYVRNGVL